MNPKILPLPNAPTMPAPARAPSPVEAPDNDLGSCGRAGRQQPDLSEERDAAACATDIFGRRLDRHQRALTDGFASRRQNWIYWPVIGAGLDLPKAHTIDWTLYGQDFHRGTAISVYASVCDGLCSLGKLSRLALGKVGISTRPDLSARMMEANTDRYGSLFEADGKIVDEPGFDSWEALRLPPSTEPVRLSPVERLPRGLLVSLPQSMNVEVFDDTLTALLAPCALAHWIGTPDGERHCARLDVDPRRLRRFTAHVNADGAIRLKQSRELYIFRRSHDVDRLVAAIEGLIARHLLSLDGRAETLGIAHARPYPCSKENEIDFQ